jgi:hypothetical protein
VFVHCLCCLGAIFSRASGSHLLVRALGSQGRPQGPPRVRSNKIIRFPIRCPIRSYYIPTTPATGRFAFVRWMPLTYRGCWGATQPGDLVALCLCGASNYQNGM